MPPGFLAVASQPSSQLTLEEFHAWYEEEHIPLRLNRLSAFVSGARYEAMDIDVRLDSQVVRTRPGWLAMYEIDDTQTFGAEEYTSLRLKRSEREKDVMGRLEVLTRKTGEALGVWNAYEGLDSEKTTTGLKVGKPSKFVVTHGWDNVLEGPSPANYATLWAEKVGAALKDAQDGWVRTRLVKVLESGKTKMGTNVQQEDEEDMKYFVVHEFEDGRTAGSDETKVLVDRVGEGKIGDWRVWKLHKAYPSIAQGNYV